MKFHMKENTLVQNQSPKKRTYVCMYSALVCFKFTAIPSDTFSKAVYYFAQAGSNFEPVYIFEVIYGLQRDRILLSKVIYGLKNGPRSEVIYGL